MLKEVPALPGTVKVRYVGERTADGKLAVSNLEDDLFTAEQSTAPALSDREEELRNDENEKTFVADDRGAVVRDRQPAPVFDSATFPVQESSSLPAEPVQAELGLPVEDKGLPAQPVQAKLAACPVLASWRQVEGIWLPRYFTAVPHLKYERVSLSSTFKPVAETKTGLQIQWNTACSVCERRFRPVAGFITILHIERMKEMNDDEQQNFVARIIQDKFAAGVSGQHPKCIS